VKLLIVEDNSGMRSLIRSMLENDFEYIHELSDGDGSLDAYSRFRPDWVIMDIKMKRMDGITATDLLKKKFPEAKIIMLTNLPYPELRTAAQKAGAEWYVMKESLSEVQEIIRKHR
jgi:DNA-binding NarL/FixJ family response regulator